MSIPDKNQKSLTIEPEKKPDERSSTWEDDQSKHEYYYDDAHGYEVYDPEDDECSEDRKTP